jgi:signal transduction histidine kinase
MQKILREKSTELIDTDVNKLIQKVMQSVRKEYKEDTVSINLNLDQKNENVKLYAEMENALTNILNNGCYAVIEKGKITKNYTPEVSVTTQFNAENVEIFIKDNGKGIPEKELKQLFSPFFTTKPTAIGTGLGLYISQDIIKTHKGEISVTSREGEYTQFSIMIPKKLNNNVHNN